MNLAKCLGVATVTVVALGSTLAGAQRGANTPVSTGAQYVEHELRVPVPGSGAAGLDALEVYVNTPGKHPLALLTHGTSNSADERKEVTPWAYLQQAVWFAQRGYVSLVIVRRGYGNSGGEMDGTHGGCNNGNFEDTGEAAADDLRNAVTYAQRSMPEVDATHVISSGVSTGGFTQVALTADPPRGLETAISFAGGRGGDGNGHLCDESGFESALHYFGKHSHTPMLWIYAENDKWFPPPFAKKFEAAFQSGGGKDVFVLAPPDGADGHHLYAHVAAWPAAVDIFLEDHDLQPLQAPYPLPRVPIVDPPAGVHGRGLEGFQGFLRAGPNKAFASNGEGAWGSSAGQLTQALADHYALENCGKNRHGGPACEVVARTTPQ